MNTTNPSGRLLLLCTTTGYQTRAYVEAAEKLGLTIVFGTDRCHVLDDPWGDGALPLRFEDPEESAQRVVAETRSRPIDAIVALGDRPTPTAARACRALGLPGHPPEAADDCRDKFRSRERLQTAGLFVPAFARFSLQADPRALAQSVAQGVGFPCVLKPLALSASRGVIRADGPEQFVKAFERIRALLLDPEVRVLREESSDYILAEAYLEGEEIAVEGLMDRGRLRVLAIFDKPDPLVGPYFEETIYVTPSRLKPEAHEQVTHLLEGAARALGLHHGPMHAEIRINPKGLAILEVAARSIGGLCSRALRFRAPSLGDDLSLEEVILRLALGQDVGSIRREDAASGVMMLPTLEAGIFQEVRGLAAARETSGVEEVVITAKASQHLVPWPEGSSYLGFIFARGPSPEFVEDALRRAQRKLEFVLAPALPVM